MYSKLAFFVVSAFTLGALAALADPAAAGAPPLCNGGTAYCCNAVLSAESDLVQKLASSLGIPLADLPGSVGFGCINMVSGGNSCTAEPVCCYGPSFRDLIVNDCSPLSFNV